MRPTPAPTHAVTARAPEKQADATAGAVVRAEGLPTNLADIADLIGSIDNDLPADLSARKKRYLRLWGFGRDRSAQARQQR